MENKELKLSILICTMPSRREKFEALRKDLESQRTKLRATSVEIIWSSNMERNVGQKRNQMLNFAKGEYVVFCDDDDSVSPNYIHNILMYIDLFKPDCIGINGVITFNGVNERKWYISKEYGRWYQEGEVYYRTPNHISPIRRELALQAGFPDISFGEDFEFSQRVLPLLKTEAIISEPMYYYNYRDDDKK